MPTDPDRVALERRILVRSEGKADAVAGVRKSFASVRSKLAGGSGPASLFPIVQEYRAYRYTRDGEIVNEAMGYGERLEETFWSPTATGETIVTRISQRTKSGRQRLSPPKSS